MPAGRPTEGRAHVDRLEGNDQEKRRLKAILEVIASEKSVAEACEELQVSEARFHVLRRQALQSALDGLVPAPAGRPRAQAETSPSRVEELEAEVQDLSVFPPSRPSSPTSPARNSSSSSAATGSPAGDTRASCSTL